MRPLSAGTGAPRLEPLRHPEVRGRPGVLDHGADFTTPAYPQVGSGTRVIEQLVDPTALPPVNEAPLSEPELSGGPRGWPACGSEPPPPAGEPVCRACPPASSGGRRRGGGLGGP